MIAFGRRRKLNKRIKETLHHAKLARHTREDIAPPEKITALREAADELRKARRARADFETLETLIGKVEQLSENLMPPRNAPQLRENLEVAVVAVAAAMAIRAYFFQPFKIPTGSMQPTLNGIIEESGDSGIADVFPLNIAKWMVTGTMYHKDTGKFKTAGDHVIVNRMAYNFRMPRRGDVVVFDTAGISEQGRSGEKFIEVYTGDLLLGRHLLSEFDGKLIDSATARTVQELLNDYAASHGGRVRYRQLESKGIMLTYYIKRMAGTAGEEISIRDRWLYADGQRISEPDVFMRQVDEYGGYYYDGTLASAEAVRQLAPDEFLPLGDNSANSRDGRFFGGVKYDALLGPAVVVYWPFGPHWGRIH